MRTEAEQAEERKKLMVIVNPLSGTQNKKNVPRLVEKELDHEKYDIHISSVARENHVRDLCREAVSAGYYGVVAVGGDGTMNGAAEGLRGSAVALGVIPAGSGNGLARHLGMPMSIKKALQVINLDNVEPLDCCTLNERTFVCTCGVGFDAQVAHEFAKKHQRGLVTYVRTAFQVYSRFQCERYRLTIDGHTVEEDAFVIACANASQYGNNAYIAPHASMQDGVLDVTVIKPFSRIKSALIGLELFIKRIDKDVSIHTYRGREVTIERMSAGPMHIDGEPIEMPARVTARCLPQAIRAFVPPKG